MWHIEIQMYPQTYIEPKYGAFYLKNEVSAHELVLLVQLSWRVAPPFVLNEFVIHLATVLLVAFFVLRLFMQTEVHYKDGTRVKWWWWMRQTICHICLLTPIATKYLLFFLIKLLLYQNHPTIFCLILLLTRKKITYADIWHNNKKYIIKS